VTPPGIPTPGAAVRLLGAVRRPHPLAGLVVYDADRVQEAASTADVKNSSTPSSQILSLKGDSNLGGVVHFRPGASGPLFDRP
jgi:nitrate reductase beta subunit